MPDKQAPLGICDLCANPIPGDPYTTKRKPKRFCSRQCRNTANSRAGAHIISQKNRERIESGEWQNPALLNPPDPANISAGLSRKRKAEVEAGEWRNPALTDEAREKLSRPRKHADNPTLHSAIEKLRQGTPVADLTPAEQEAHRTHRRQLRAERREEANAYARDYYHKRQQAMTPDQREAQRRKWREANRRKAQKKQATSTKSQSSDTFDAS